MPIPVSSVTDEITSSGGASLPTTVIAYADTDVQVEQLVESIWTVLANPADYTVTLDATTNLVTVVLDSATTGEDYRITNVAAVAQLTDYELASYDPRTLTRDLDKIYLALQRLFGSLDDLPNDAEPRVDGQTALEADPVSSASVEFAPGGTFTIDPTRARHRVVRIGSISSPLTDNMVVDLNPADTNWGLASAISSVTVRKDDESEFTVTVRGFDTSGTGTETLRYTDDSVTANLETLSNANGPAPGGKRFGRGVIVSNAPSASSGGDDILLNPYSVYGRGSSSAGPGASIAFAANQVLLRSGSGDVTADLIRNANIGDGEIGTSKLGGGINDNLTLASTAQQPPSEGAFVDGDKTKLDAVVLPVIANVNLATASSPIAVAAGSLVVATGTAGGDKVFVVANGTTDGQRTEIVHAGTTGEGNTISVQNAALSDLLPSFNSDTFVELVWSTASSAWRLAATGSRTGQPGALYSLSAVTPATVTYTGTPTDGAPLAFDGAGNFKVGNAAGLTSVTHANPSLDNGDTITAALHGTLYPSGSALQGRYNEARNASNVNNAVALTLETNCSLPVYVGVASDQVGTVTVDEGANTILGATAGVITLGPAGSSIWIIPLGSGVYKIEGEYVAPTTLLGGLSSPVLDSADAATAHTLTLAEHGGRTVLMTGDTTVPAVDGFSATLIASGAARDVDAGGAALEVAAGDSIVVFSDGTTVWNTDAITLATLATS